MSRPLSSPYSVELGYSFNITLANNLMYWRNAVLHQDMDCGIIVDGSEGAGKSVFGLQIAKFLDIDRQVDLDKQVCYFPKQFKEAVLSLKKGKAIVWDEARRGLNRRRSISEGNLTITDMLAECRQHNLFLIIIMPSFYDMDLNVAVWRTRILIHVWYNMDPTNVDRPLKRGYFRMYNEEGKKLLYTNKMSRQRYEYPHMPNHSFDATFAHYYVVDEAEYRKRKREAEQVYRGETKQELVDPEELKKQHVGRLFEFLRRNRWLKYGATLAVAKFYNVHETTLSTWARDSVTDAKESEEPISHNGSTHNTIVEKGDIENVVR